ncbi:S-adenosyl-L-methionine-dependent methyltransferase [Carex littledalei]|uniref:S-adenosyl-L-methionine-dependent methyltransferase n=1 Tax=Carex littledalei TaxID=544730 RepID=A0A833V4R9_9POAL|nr:S-adenosyl-L-methionine-dependent methyltransferase [Carex littledalei]
MAEEERATSSDTDQLALRDLVMSDAVRAIHLTIDTEWGSLQQSARQTAAARALWGHVVNDPLADVLAGEQLLQGLYKKMRRDRMSNAKEVSGVMLAIRTLWFDARLQAAIESFGGGHVQLVLLGAGMDARAYRLSYLKETTIFELDFPDLIQLKSDLIRQVVASSDNQTNLTVSSDRLIHVPADLREPNWLQKLTDSGFSPGTNTVWILEGILYYLSYDDAMQVLETIARALEKTAHAVLLADFMNKSAVSLSNDMYQFYSDWPDQLLPRIGFCNVKVSQIGDSDANFGLLTDPENLFERRRKIPRSVDIDSLDGSPCCRLYLVEATESLSGEDS